MSREHDTMYHFSSVDNVEIVGGHPLAAQAAMVAFSSHGITSSSENLANTALPNRSAASELAI